MKILVFNGSPKREKSNTLHITRAFLDGRKEVAAHEIHRIDVVDKHIKFCHGCFSCKYNGGRCVIDDDLRMRISQQQKEL
jgi:multimeric flavodoxin WrbA